MIDQTHSRIEPYPEGLLRDDDLAVLIVAAVGAHVVRQLDGMAARADRARGSADLHIGRATGVSGTATLFLLRYWHDDLPYMVMLTGTNTRK